MVGICFYFESYDKDVWSGRRIDLDAWNYAAKAVGDVDRIIVINKTFSEIKNPDSGTFDFKVVTEIPKLEGKIIKVCCPWDKCKNLKSLWDFDHNVDWYVFGPADGWREEIENGVYIPQNGKAALHSTHVASTVLFHRYEVLYGNNTNR
jgi:hypothetical protein